MEDRRLRCKLYIKGKEHSAGDNIIDDTKVKVLFFPFQSGKRHLYQKFGATDLLWYSSGR